jgi:hypothetical protein
VFFGFPSASAPVRLILAAIMMVVAIGLYAGMSGGHAAPAAAPVGAFSPQDIAADVASVSATALLSTPHLVWQHRYPAVAFRESSPVEASLGQPAAVVGALDGNVYGFNLITGAPLPGWPVKTAAPIDSSPATAALNGSNAVVVGSGWADGGKCSGGGVYVIDASGAIRWSRVGSDADCANEAFHASPVIGDVTGDGVPDITANALGLRSWSWDASGALSPGWPYYTDDTVFATPALADVNGDGVPDLVMGGDSSPGGTIDSRGGVVRAVTGDGRTLWQFFTDEIVRSSPAVGALQRGAAPSIVFGTGDYWDTQPGGAHDSDNVYALDESGHLEWVHDVGAETVGAPALADVEGNGNLDVAIATANGPGAGRIWVLGPNGQPLPHWAGVPSGGGVVIGGISTADLNGDGAQDLLVPTGSGVFAYSGRTGQRLFSIDADKVGFQSTPLIDVDPDGAIGITVAGTTAFGEGVVQHWVMPPISGARLGADGWPTFHHDARRTGNAVPPPLADPTCLGSGIDGYWEVGADGGVFGSCGAGFLGSPADHPLTAPVVGVASAPSGNGYWEAAADGGVFAFGDAPFLGSVSGTHLRAPIVGIAATPTGKGYWLASADGGVFAFGDARYMGGAGSVALPFHVVGIMATPNGKGYWLIGNQGTILTYGAAPFFGSPVGVPLHAPIVGGAATPTGLGYWLVAADGGIFTYGNASYLGSPVGVPLRAPIVGMAASAAGRGYWVVAADGGVFTYGDARFVSSPATLRLNRAIVGVAIPGS